MSRAMDGLCDALLAKAIEARHECATSAHSDTLTGLYAGKHAAYTDAANMVRELIAEGEQRDIKPEPSSVASQPVFFYERDFYVLSNFSSFRLRWKNADFDTSEHAYHWEKFLASSYAVALQIRYAASAHEAFKLADKYRDQRRSDWDAVKVGIMRDILREKAHQHAYVQRKLLATGDRQLIEDSWRDDFWGWGPNKDGKNMLGRLWMEIRGEIRANANSPDAAASPESVSTGLSTKQAPAKSQKAPQDEPTQAPQTRDEVIEVPESDLYETAQFVGIPGEQITGLLGILKMCGAKVVRVALKAQPSGGKG